MSWTRSVGGGEVGQREDEAETHVPPRQKTDRLGFGRGVRKRAGIDLLLCQLLLRDRSTLLLLLCLRGDDPR